MSQGSVRRSGLSNGASAWNRGAWNRGGVPFGSTTTPRSLEASRVGNPTGRAFGGASSDALSRYRSAIGQARGRTTQPWAGSGGPSSLRARGGLESSGDSLRRRTPASTSGPTATLPTDGSTGTRALGTRSRLGDASGGTIADRLRLRREGGTARAGAFGSGAAGPTDSLGTRRVTSSGAGSDLRTDSSRSFGARSRIRSSSDGGARSGLVAGSRVITSGDGHGDGYTHRSLRRHDGHHDHHHGHVHHHHDGGWYVSWWGGWWYDNYSSFWLGGLPAFGFGVAYYDPYYAPYFDPGVVVIEQPYPVVVQQPVYVDPSAVAPSAPAPAAVEGGAPPSADEGDAAKQAFETGLRAFSEQRYEQALGMFRLVTELDPMNGEAWLGRAHASLALGQYADAAAAVAEAAELGAFPRGYRFDPRPVYKVQGAFDSAFGRLQAYAKGNPQDADAHLLLAWLHVGLGEHEKAKASLDGLKALRADDPTAAFLRAAMLPPEPPAQKPADGEPVRPPAPSGATPGVLPPPPGPPSPGAPAPR